MQRTRSALLLGVASLVVAACGARLSDEQWESLRTTDDTLAPVETIVEEVSGATTTTAATGVDGGGSSNEQGGGAVGGGGGPAAPTNGGGDAGAPQGETCGGGGASDVGITETEIRIGNVSTISGPVPGFGQTGVNAVKAYFNFVNANGGVCGRQLTLVTADDRLQSGTNKSETDKLKSEVLGFVGGTSVVDDGSAQSLAGTNIVDVSMAITDAKISSSNNFSTVPINLDDGGNNSLSIMRYMNEVRGVETVALVFPAQAAAKARMEGYKLDLSRAGIEVVVEAEVAVTETNYADEAQNIKANEADMLLTTLEISGMARLAKALEQNDYFPPVPFYGAQAYGKTFISQTGSAGEPTVLGLGYSILEDAAAIPAVNDLVEWYARTNPGSEIDFFAIQTWAAADMYVDALRSIEGAPTRDKVMNYMTNLTSFDADGLLAPLDPANKIGSKCFMIAEVENGAWVRSHPAEGFDCSFG